MNREELELIIEKDRVVPAMDNIVCNRKGMLVEIGCGKNRKKGFIGIDIFLYKNVDLCIDIDEELSYPFKKSSVSGIRAIHSLEHIQNFKRLWNEIYRICEDGALIYAVVPHPKSSYYFQDPTHKTFYTEKTFQKYLDKSFTDVYTDYQLDCKIVCEQLFCLGPSIEKLSIHALLRVIKKEEEK